MDPFAILELLMHEGITHFPICLRGLTLSKITTLLTHHENNRKSFLPLQEASRCTQTSHAAGGQCFCRWRSGMERTRDSVSPSLPRKELETCPTTRTARLSPTFTPPVDEKENERVSEGARSCPRWLNATPPPSLSIRFDSEYRDQRSQTCRVNTAELTAPSLKRLFHLPQLWLL